MNELRLPKPWMASLAGAAALLNSGCATGTPSASTAASAKLPRYALTPTGQKPRVVITADPELDDSNSLVRYLLYSPDYRTEGLVYASSQFHWKGDGKGTKFSVPGREYNRFGLNMCPCTSWRWAPDERFIDDAVDAYEKAWPNLRIHDAGYPSPQDLRSKIRWGNVEFDGEMERDTDGSNLIKSLLLDVEETPIYLHAWGGQSTIARALKSIEEQYKSTTDWDRIRAKVVRKAVIHPSGDQDDTYEKYIKPNWPDIRYREQQGSVPFGYNVEYTASLADAQYFTKEWTQANVSQRGPLGAFYRVWGDGRQMVQGDKFDYFWIAGKTAAQLRAEGYVVWTPVHEKGSFLGEGDTGTFVNLIDNGLDGYRDDSFGGWGGYLRRGPRMTGATMFAIPADALKAVDNPNRNTTKEDHPFLAAAQRDFAARFVWATTPDRAKANHPPVVRAQGAKLISAKPGETIRLAVSTSDPDDNAVAMRWWHWAKAGTFEGTLTLSQESGSSISLVIPTSARPGDTIQIVAEGTDNGTPTLTRYAKFVITVAN